MPDKEFISIARELLHSEEFIRMKSYRHHVRSNLYRHSVKVAYLCYKHHKRFRMKCDLRELIFGALLHDYYLYDLHGEGEKHRLHWLKHPRRALENALLKYPDLTRAQRDMIRCHMFPICPIPPKTLSGWLVCFYDKVVAISDRFERRTRTTV